MAKTTYKSSGVDIDAGNLFVDLIKPLAKSTANKNVLGKLGGFSGAYELPKKYKNPILLAAADGVGTKLKIAFMTGKFDTVGIDLVAMNVNDIVTCGAEPLFFLDYIATSKLTPEEGVNIVKGIAAGCKQAGCALLGGETAEMPGFYRKDEFDLAGFVVGIVDKTAVIDGSSVKVGDAVIGIASSGLHSNGYSLARKVLLGKNKFSLSDKPKPLRRTLANELLEPTKIYAKTLLSLMKIYKLKAMAHITGGGLLENIPRVLPKTCAVEIDSSTWRMPPIMKLIQEQGQIDQEEMYRTFNCGIGMVIVVNSKDSKKVLTRLQKLGEKASLIGEVRKKKRNQDQVVIV
ncbi:MAG: phosphoribosylformylglycinamidine cyclo-ligase [Thermodesulfobacteriota bacterium]|nr:MAG: phosphoribosylformylglycinamidine cyclo-ligase [Thermodesulfobacteriota bacterium]